ncbi:MAG: serine/threonine protein kinase [Kiritimatiellaeota bacterium]|nr:serine/threonine protein kinase [Kiritimatiellota bacterium]
MKTNETNQSLVVTRAFTEEPDGKRFNSAKLSPGDRFGNYEIIDFIARGGSGAVHLAEHTDLNRTVALKIVSSHLAEDDSFREMFTREAKASSKLNHPNIVQTYDAGTIDGTPYLAMEYIEGGSLKDYVGLPPEESMPLPKLLSIMRDVADALRYGQETLQLTHGDIKPENILLSFDDKPHLADFGLSETIASKKKMEGNSTKVLATPVYVAPEIVARQALPGDPRPDIYSFGCMMFHLITGEPPFKASDVSALILSHMRKKAPSLMSLVPGICKNLSDLVDEMLQKHPNDRPQNWIEARNRISDIIEELKHPRTHILKRHIALVVAFTQIELKILIAACAALMIYLHPVLGTFLAALILLINYLIKSLKEPQNWLGIFKE